MQRIGWARLIKRVFGADPLECPNCHRAMRLVSVVMEPRAMASILAAPGVGPASSSAHSARGPPQMELAFDQADDTEHRLDAA